MIFNVREQHEHLCYNKVVQKMKYIGIEIDNKRNYFTTQRGKIIENATEIANITYSVIERSADWDFFLEKYSSTITSVWYKYNKFDR